MSSRPPPPKKHGTDKNEISELTNIFRFDDVSHGASSRKIDVRIDSLTGGVLVAKVELLCGGLKVCSQDGDEVGI